MALPAHTPTTWDDILSTTMHNTRKQLTDNIFSGRPLLDHFMSNGRVRTVNGGISIVEPLIISEGDFKSYAEWDTIVVTPVNTATAAQFPWKQMVATIAISGLEEAQNNGTEMRINLLEAKVMQAEETMKAKLNQMLFGTRPNPQPATDFEPLTTLIDDTLPAGGITPTTGGDADYWKSVVGGGAITDAASFEAMLGAAFLEASDAGGDKVDAIFTTPEIFSYFESTLTPQVRYSDVTKANLGFTNLLYKSCPIFWDNDCPDGVVLGINSKYVGLTLHSERNFKQSPFTANLTGSTAAAGAGPGGPGIATATALDARVSFITTYGNTTIRNRRRNFKLEGVTLPV